VWGPTSLCYKVLPSLHAPSAKSSVSIQQHQQQQQPITVTCFVILINVKKETKESKMLHCANTSGNLAGDMTVWERQRARMKWQEEQGYFSAFDALFSSSSSSSLHLQDSFLHPSDSGCALGEVVAQAQAQPRSMNKPSVHGFDASSSILRTFSCPPALVEPEPEPEPRPTGSSIGKESSKKRKPEKLHNAKVCEQR